MKDQSYNENAMAATLTLLGVNIGDMTKLYIALDKAERRGEDFGYGQGYGEGFDYFQSSAFNDGYDSGYADGYSDGISLDPTEDAIEEFNFNELNSVYANDKVQANAQLEVHEPASAECTTVGCRICDENAVTARAAASLDDCPF